MFIPLEIKMIFKQFTIRFCVKDKGKCGGGKLS